MGIERPWTINRPEEFAKDDDHTTMMSLSVWRGQSSLKASLYYYRNDSLAWFHSLLSEFIWHWEKFHIILTLSAFITILYSKSSNAKNEQNLVVFNLISAIEGKVELMVVEWCNPFPGAGEERGGRQGWGSADGGPPAQVTCHPTHSRRPLHHPHHHTQRGSAHLVTVTTTTKWEETKKADPGWRTLPRAQRRARPSGCHPPSTTWGPGRRRTLSRRPQRSATTLPRARQPCPSRVWPKATIRRFG